MKKKGLEFTKNLKTNFLSFLKTVLNVGGASLLILFKILSFPFKFLNNNFTFFFRLFIIIILGIVLLQTKDVVNKTPQTITQNDNTLRIFNDLSHYTVFLTRANKKGTGTGFHVQTDNGNLYILTNKHVCGYGNKEMLAASPTSGRFLTRRIIEMDVESDLCIIEALPDQKSGLKLAKEVRMLEQIWILGYPQSMPLVITTGTLLAKQLTSQKLDDNFCKENIGHPKYDYYEVTKDQPWECSYKFNTYITSAPIYFGNSGSMVVNKDYEVIGVVWGLVPGQNYSLVVALELVKDFIAPY